MMESKWARMDEEMTEQLEKAARLVLSLSAELSHGSVIYYKIVKFHFTSLV